MGNVLARQAERYREQADAAKIEGDSQEETKLTQLAAQNTRAALDVFEQSVRSSQANGGLTEAKALLNLNRLLERSPSSNHDLIARNRTRVLALLEDGPDSRDKAYALINLATSPPQAEPGNETAEKVKLLEKAIAIAQNIGNRRAQSFALGSLGQIYESAKQYEKAMALTRQAQFAASWASECS